MYKFFKHKKSGRIITNDEYMSETLENVETNSLDMAKTGMDLNTDVFGSKDDYEPYEDETAKETE